MYVPDPAECQGVLGRLDSAVVGVIDHNLVLMSMPKKDICDDVRRITVDDLIEQVGWIRERVRTVPASQDVA